MNSRAATFEIGDVVEIVSQINAIDDSGRNHHQKIFAGTRGDVIKIRKDGPGDENPLYMVQLKEFVYSIAVWADEIRKISILEQLAEIADES